MSITNRNAQSKLAADGLPVAGFVRLADIIGHGALLPISRSAWWAGVRTGRYPQPVKLGPRITAWRCEDIRLFLSRGVQ